MTQPSPDWQNYEQEVHAELSSKYHDALVRHNVRLRGSRSGAERQIDVLVEETLPGGKLVTAVDAKFHSRSIDVKDVEAFIGLLQDVQVDRGIMITNHGYSEAALSRAFRDDVDLDLDILTLDAFKHWQSALAIPYAGRNGVVLPAPVGWVVDGERVPGALARVYRRGLTFPQAKAAGEFMYLNIWDRRPPVQDLDQLLAKQRKDILRSFPDAFMSVRDFARADFPTCLRRAEIPSYPSAELTAFVEFPTMIPFVVLFSPLVVERRNLRKLEYIVKKIIRLKVTHAG